MNGSSLNWLAYGLCWDFLKGLLDESSQHAVPWINWSNISHSWYSSHLSWVVVDGSVVWWVLHTPQASCTLLWWWASSGMYCSFPRFGHQVISPAVSARVCAWPHNRDGGTMVVWEALYQGGVQCEWLWRGSLPPKHCTTVSSSLYLHSGPKSSYLHWPRCVGKLFFLHGRFTCQQLLQGSIFADSHPLVNCTSE